MRIIAGSKKGMKLFSPKTFISRPITDRVKESLFSVLLKYGLPAGKRVADLFCGVGSLGLEALSRGAESVAFIEKDNGIAKTLKRNIEKAGFIKEGKIFKTDAFKTGAWLIQNRKYDLVFVDPPYAAARTATKSSAIGCLLLLLNEQLNPGGFVVVRTEKNVNLLQSYGSLDVVECRKWGTMIVTILRLNKNDK